MIDTIRQTIGELNKQVAEKHIRDEYERYYCRVEEKCDADIAVLLADLERFDRAIAADLQARLTALTDPHQMLFDDPQSKGQRTRLENQLKAHR